MRWSRALVFVLFAVLVAACGGAPASSAGGDGGDGGDGGSSQAQATQAPASQGGGGGGGDAGDAEEVFNALIPPNSTETSKSTFGGAITATYTSTDSVDSLISHYDGAIPATGMEVVGTTNAQGAHSWVFAESEGSSFSGSITVSPDQTGSAASQVLVIVTPGE